MQREQSLKNKRVNMHRLLSTRTCKHTYKKKIPSDCVLTGFFYEEVFKE